MFAIEAAAVALKFAVVAPATTVTNAGTVSKTLLLASVTADPPAGAVWVSVTVHALTAPCPRLVRLQDKAETRTGAVSYTHLDVYKRQSQLRRQAPEVTQMVTDRKKNSRKAPEKQGSERSAPEPNRINGSTPYDFNGKNLTPYGGLLPVVTMLEKLDFQSLVEETLTSKRIPRVMDLYRFVLGIVLGLYIGFPRLNQLRFIARDPILTGILKVGKLPVQSTFWRFVNGLHRNIARQILTVMSTMRERVWAAANVKLDAVTIDTDTTVHTLYGLSLIHI